MLGFEPKSLRRHEALSLLSYIIIIRQIYSASYR